MSNKILIPIIIASSFGAGFGSAMIFAKTRKKKDRISNCYGYLRIDRSEPDEPPKIFLELETMPNNLVDGDYITLQVKQQNYI